MPKPRLSLLAVVLLALFVAACGGGGSSTGDAGGGTTSAAPPAEGGESTVPAEELEPPNVDWPFFGRVPQRTHYLSTDQGSIDRPLDPPLKQAWSINTHALIEFPPAVNDGVAYVINKYGNGKAVRLRDQKVLWELNLDPKDEGGQRDVTSPVYYRGKVYGAFLDGTLAAGQAATGRKVWARHLGAHLESSPLPVEGNLYLGTDKHQVLAIDAGTGETIWTFDAPGAIKASPSYDAGRLFVADYESTMLALDPQTGKQIWRTNTSTVPPYGHGGFFSSPAVEFGNVYAARDDGTVFAFDESTGKVKWSFAADGAVYGSPAVAQVPGSPPTVYLGSEAGTFYALDARTGKLRWRRKVGGVPGTTPVIGHTVYVSSFETDKTIGIDVLTHKKTFEIDQAGYTPMVSDGRRLYLIGYFTLIGLEPTTP